MLRVHLSPVSGNKKTGPIPVSTTSAESCPSDCPFMGSGCYAQSGPLAIHWKAVSRGERGMSWADFCLAIARLPAGVLWRHNQAGDLPHADGTIWREGLMNLVRANAKGKKRGFTYTHHDVLRNWANRDYVRDANMCGFTVNLSGNDLAHADALAAADCGPVVVVLPSDVQGNQVVRTPAGRKVVVCPATYREDVSCASCGLCARADRDCIVGFPAHGSGVRKATAVAQGRA